MKTTFRKLDSENVSSEFKIVFRCDGDVRALVLIHKATNKVADFISLREPIHNKAISPEWYNHDVIFQDSNPVEHPLSELPRLLKEQKENSLCMMEFMIYHNDIMKEMTMISLRQLTMMN